MKPLLTFFILLPALMLSFKPSAPAPVFLSPANMQHELEILHSAFSQFHPGLYRYNSPEQIDSLFNRAKIEAQKPLTERNYYLLLARLCEKIKCGHTYPNFWNQKEEFKQRNFSSSVLPLLFCVKDGKIIITHNLSQSKVNAGDELLGINGITAKSLIDTLLQVSRSDGENGMNRKLDNLGIYPFMTDTTEYSLFDVYAPMCFPALYEPAQYKCTIRTASGKNRTVLLQPLSKAQRLHEYTARFGTLASGENSWYLNQLSTETALLHIGDFATWNWKRDYSAFLDSIFLALTQNGTTNLIVDIRGNEGGLDDARDNLFSRLIAEPFVKPQAQRLRTFLSVPDSMRKYFRTWNTDLYRPQSKAEFSFIENRFYIPINPPAGDTIYPRKNAFKGKCYLLTNATNSSAAFTLAQMFRQAKCGLIAGETTGGNMKGINGGQFFMCYLPHSGIEIDIPLIWYRPLKALPDAGINPDIPVQITPQSIAQRRDPALETVMKMIEKNK
ncbi:MAG: S41 family peptidase [Bacteroidia bacterium]|jgi:hypothetical protein|nr:S41 family peptidase [Bacteroidia bacterium]